MPFFMLSRLWSYRGFILGNVKREFQSKYRNSLLGALWTVLNPLAMIVVYTVIFSHVMKTKLSTSDGAYSYSIYLCAGILFWGLFSDIVGRAQTVFIDNANLIKKINFPRLCLPVIIVLNSLVNFSIIFSIFTIFLLLSHSFPGWIYFSLIPVMFVLVLFAIGLGITLGVLNVFFRDVGHFFGIFLQFWFWLTPIVYPSSILPENVKVYLNLNPLAGIIASCQSILVQHIWPDWWGLVPSLCAGLLFTWIALILFRQHSGEMVDEL
ncbi:ABC transporter permease [Dickeya oryzae]|uniref:ABC transporter permease n=1 Tax=Dickeya oryzae TaxID=1240404 RepID=UPI00294FF10E|nr:ABC transporter permease [Dickeya oryzae]